MRRLKRGNLEPDHNSIIINIIPVLKSRNIKHPTAFLKKIGISPSSVNKLLQGRASQINMKQLTKLCVALNCTPDNLFMLRNMELPPKHALNDLPKMEQVPDVMTVEEFLADKRVEEVQEMLKR